MQQVGPEEVKMLKTKDAIATRSDDASFAGVK
jgi:hypothetical protein